MDKQSQVLCELNWYKLVPHEYKLNSGIFQLSNESMEWLLSDDMNQAIETFPQYQAVSKGIKQIGQVYVKCADRTPRDVALPLTAIHNMQELMLVLKTSQYMIEGMDEYHQQHKKCYLVLRQYLPPLTKQTNIYNIYVWDSKVIGIAQKYPHHIEQPPSAAHVQLMIELIQDIDAVVSVLKLQKYIVSAAILLDKVKITKISSYHINQFSLFTHEQLCGDHEQPLIKTATKEQQLKQYDLREYQMGHQLNTGEKMQEWKEFIKQN